MNIRGEQGGIGAGQGGGRRKTLKTSIFRTDRCRAGERQEKNLKMHGWNKNRGMALHNQTHHH